MSGPGAGGDVRAALQNLRDANMSYSLVSDAKNARRLEQAMRDADAALAKPDASNASAEARLHREPTEAMLNAARDARLLGNVRAKDIVRAIDAIKSIGVEDLERIKADPGDGSLAPDLGHILARGFHAMGWERPQNAAHDMILAILSLLNASDAERAR